MAYTMTKYSSGRHGGPLGVTIISWSCQTATAPNLIDI